MALLELDAYTEQLNYKDKQCLRIYKDHFCVAKILVGEVPQTLELHRNSAGYAIASLNKSERA